MDETTNAGLAALFNAAPGDTVELPGLMTGLCPDPVVGTIKEVSPTGVKMALSYCGAFLCERTVMKTTKGGYAWA